MGDLTATHIERVPDITNGLLTIKSEGWLLKILTDTRAESGQCFCQHFKTWNKTWKKR